MNGNKARNSIMKRLQDIDFSVSPFIVIWEITQACDLACRHCRAEAIDWSDPQELTTDEGLDLIDQVHSLGAQIMVLTGGDPAKREDLCDLIRHGSELGLRMATIPAATNKLTPELVKNLKSAGLSQIALSLDGPNSEVHDTFRGVQGAFDLTIKGAEYIREEGIPLQINTTFSEYNFDYFDKIGELVKSLGVVFWEVFFLVPMGRGKLLKQMSARQFEKLFEKLYNFSKEVDFIVKITEAQHYRRYVIEQEKQNLSMEESLEVKLPDRMTRDFGPGGSIGHAPKGVNAGNGYVFISHIGDIYPSGFLPLKTGDVRNDVLADVYRDHEIFRLLRNSDCLLGKCGLCEYRNVCGGCRSRAYAMAGDIMAPEPFCVYNPRK